ncbi:hypothetical protein [Candidatus Endoriftia persephone]|jgi:hypothetical protein|uniref:Uncharacterized protein n=2 Tax=Gammaproteobacteria TaxID=1236 RepID=G2D9N2_9GAMM|nr:hypothetical protein [Candidatus Endoriftia persephone]EGV52694.1 hypothetical protein Rifp1Sym_ad00410 [endosymbiont of Riftia pachyptila (vent Ph05)]USF86312.1 hypothetical protein L0Y14_09145 [Candidatus Endoriftia persephone]
MAKNKPCSRRQLLCPSVDVASLFDRLQNLKLSDFYWLNGHRVGGECRYVCQLACFQGALASFLKFCQAASAVIARIASNGVKRSSGPSSLALVVTRLTALQATLRISMPVIGAS